ncbi:tastin [Eublepharis macularius]|uniref:Tastin n=1 Tax=Eublepharis macularius TaxID=481883 RepID=A0AA97LL94_EUBMA|nr:tastin [Eublepharis macularius]
MAQSGKENAQGGLPLRGKKMELGQKESTAGSKIPVLVKSRPPAEQQAGPSAVKSQGCKTAKLSSVGVPVPEPTAGLLSMSSAREPLGPVQLSVSGHRNMLEVGNANDKEARAVEFVPDAAALASILSNTGLSNHTGSANQKPSLARRVPLRGNRACSASTGTGQGSRCGGAAARMSHLSRPASKDMEQPRSCILALNAQQLKALSTRLGDLGPGVEAKHSQPTESLEAGNCKDSSARPKTERLNSVTEAGNAKQSTPSGSKGTTGASWTEEEFVPDPAAKASILSNVGVSHSALGPGGKMSLARRVPVRDVRKPPGSVMAENVSPATPKFGRVSCRSTKGLKGLKESGVSRAHLAVTPSNRCSMRDCLLTSEARRVPVAHPPSLGKIAVRLFNDGLEASAKRVPAGRVIPSDMGKLQRVEFLARLLQQEINSSVDEVAPSLEELHKLLSVRCSPASEAPEPDLVITTPLQDPTRQLGEQPVVPAASVAPVPSTTPNTTDSQPVCSAPSLPSLGPSPSGADSRGVSATSSSVAHIQQRVAAFIDARRHFYEGLLDDECAFYTSRVPTFAQSPVPRCKEPVAKALDAEDTTHFTPISTQSPLAEVERFSPL